MKYSGALFAVADIQAATAFYKELFGLAVEFDFGRCVSFEGGLSLQQDFAWLTGIPADEIKHKENNCEMFFESEDFDEFVQKLSLRRDIKLLHDVKTYSWGQRVIRFYDLDGHLIEVGEDSRSVVERFMAQGMTIDEIAEVMDVTASDVWKMLSP